MFWASVRAGTPLSVTGYAAAMIQDQGARSASVVLANDPSIRLQGAGDGNYDYFTIRGFTISAAAFSMNGLYGILPWNTFSPETVEQFEVVRGPSTTLTGASPFDNPGGAVNIQPKRQATNLSPSSPSALMRADRQACTPMSDDGSVWSANGAFTSTLLFVAAAWPAITSRKSRTCRDLGWLRDNRCSAYQTRLCGRQCRPIQPQHHVPDQLILRRNSLNTFRVGRCENRRCQARQTDDNRKNYSRG